MDETKLESKPTDALTISLMPVSLVLIIAATAIPIELRNPSINFVDWCSNGPDV